MGKVVDVPLGRRTNIRSLSKAMDVAKSTMYRRVLRGEIRSHSSALKPQLTNENKENRVRFCLSWLDPPDRDGKFLFKDMMNVIHIDEKLFYMSKTAEKYYLHPTEADPYRTCKSKRFIPKIMFLAAVARPRFDSFRNEYFSGKVGIFPFTTIEPAKRKSKNRPAGSLETKPILSVAKEVQRSFLIKKVLPAIQEKWPFGDRLSPIYIQQDNAKPHISPSDSEFAEAVRQTGLDIRLCFQPANSPDLNVLDLGYFRSIQSLKDQEAPRSIDELVTAVEKSFNELPIESLDNVFLSLQSCMIEKMKLKGGNNYSLPHIGKGRLRAQGCLPTKLECDRAIVEMCNSH